MNRPFVISLIAVYSGLVGMLPFAVSIKFFLDDNMPLWLSLVQLSPALVMFVFAVGLWRLRPWGCWLALAYYVFEIVYSAQEAIGIIGTSTDGYTIYALIIAWQILIASAIVIYLARPSVREVFIPRINRTGRAPAYTRGACPKGSKRDQKGLSSGLTVRPFKVYI